MVKNSAYHTALPYGNTVCHQTPLLLILGRLVIIFAKWFCTCAITHRAFRVVRGRG